MLSDPKNPHSGVCEFGIDDAVESAHSSEYFGTIVDAEIDVSDDSVGAFAYSIIYHVRREDGTWFRAKEFELKKRSLRA